MRYPLKLSISLFALTAISGGVFANEDSIDSCTGMPLPSPIHEIIEDLDSLKEANKPGGRFGYPSGYVDSDPTHNENGEPVGETLRLISVNSQLRQQMILKEIVGGGSASYVDFQSTNNSDLSDPLAEAEIFYSAFIHALPTFSQKVALRSAHAFLDEYDGKSRSPRSNKIAKTVISLLDTTSSEEEVEGSWANLISSLGEVKRLFDVKKYEASQLLLESVEKDMTLLLGKRSSCKDNPGLIVGQTARLFMESYLDLLEKQKPNGDPWVANVGANRNIKPIVDLMLLSIDPISYPLLASQSYLTYARYNVSWAQLNFLRRAKYEAIAARAEELSSQVLK